MSNMSEVVLSKVLEEYKSRHLTVTECVIIPGDQSALKLTNSGRFCYVSASVDDRFAEETLSVVQSTNAIATFAIATVHYLGSPFRFPTGTNFFDDNRDIYVTRAGEMRLFFRNECINTKMGKSRNFSILAALDKQNTAPFYDKYKLGNRKGMN